MPNNTQRYLLDVPHNGDHNFVTYLGVIKEAVVELQKTANLLQKAVEALENSNASVRVVIDVPKHDSSATAPEKLHEII